jgi:predicted O-linked N-acetylglucosamine transferase (SPINDLY family)
MNLIRKDNLDILFDLSGHTKNNRLPIFKNRCAPVQATWCGWLASTGIKEIDYIIGDMHSTPLSDQWKFIEKIYQLKKIWQCLSISSLESKISSTKKNNEKFVTFGSFHNILKINESVITTWSKILNQVPNSKLLLKTSSFNILEVRENFLKLFANNGVNKNQIIFNGNSPRSEYLQFYNNIDIALDTFPINGGTTSFEAAYMGVPVLTKISEKSFWFRSGESINKNLSMNDWIAKDEEDYVSKAIKFSENKNYLINLKNELRNIAIKSPLFDSESFSNDFYEMLLNIAKR